MINFLFKTAIVSLSAVSLAVASAQAATPECRTAALPDGTPAMFCKDRSGKWKQQEGGAAAPVSAVPPKAQITYRGTFSVSLSDRPRAQRNLNLNNILNQAINQAVNSNARRIEGALTFVAKFDGPAVTATISGTGGMNSGVMTGLVRDGVCRLTNETNTEIYEGECTTSGFSGTVKSTPTNKFNISGTFNTQASDFVDSTQRDAERAELRRQCDAGKTTACVALDQK